MPEGTDLFEIIQTTRAMSSIPAPQVSGTRSWFMSMRQSCRTRRSPASRSSRTGRAFLQKRRGAWRATPAAW